MNNSEIEKQSDETSVAIIGMAGRFPKSKNIDEFWQRLRDGVECISFFTDEELAASGINPDHYKQPNYVKARGVLDDIDMFDAPFFGFTPREAEIMDPQHRLFLECAWQALENAGYDSEKYNGLIGVYAGVNLNYYVTNVFSNAEIMQSVNGLQIRIANEADHLPLRVSYKLNLKGPSVNIQTACSTSLVAVHFACQSLLNGECNMALAGGASVHVPKKNGYFYQEGMIASPDGHCRAFDAKAQGTLGGSGVGIVVLKRLADALADGDSIHAVIKGTAVNNDGSLKVGYTAPSEDGQAEVIAEALAVAGVDPETINYVEAHGTATSLGDPIEIKALTRAFGGDKARKNYCGIGSVKSNIGHLDAGAGIAGLIKTVLSLKHKMIPPSLHFEKPNPKLDLESSPFYVNAKLSQWKAGRTPRRAGVSSFGIGGTNAHLILEESPVVETSKKSRPSQLLVLSARTGSALNAATANLLEHLKQNPELELADAAYTLQVGRRGFNHRRMLVCSDTNDAVAALEKPDAKRVFTLSGEPKNHPIVFMFTGQGSQYVNMGLDLFHTEPSFREQVDRCSQLLKPLLGLDLRDVLYPGEGQAKEAAQQLEQTCITQPALFVIEYALAKLWMRWGVRPQAMIGHSIGEYVAACLAGVLSLEDALKLVAARGRLMQELPRGAMLAVPLSRDSAQAVLGERLSLAAVNGPRMCVISGPDDAIDELQKGIIRQGIDSRRLHTSHAFHSQMMESILAPFTEQVKKIKLNAPNIPYISNVTGTWITAEQATDPRYWASHLRQTVLFSDGLRELAKKPNWILLEVGPGQVLSKLAGQQQDKGARPRAIASLRAANDSRSDVEFLLNALGRLWAEGIEVDWAEFYADEQRRRVALPTYPFEREQYWIERQFQPQADNTGSTGLRKKPDIADWFYIPSWRRSELTRATDPEKSARAALCWLVFADECGLGSLMANQLESDGQDVITITVGKQFAKLSDGLYTVNPDRAGDYKALFRELGALNKSPRKIVHLWSVTPAGDNQSDAVSFENSQALGFYSLLYIGQSLGELNIIDALEIFVVSNNLQEVTGEEKLCPEKATVLGPCKVGPQEYPSLTCRNIDIVIPESGSRQQQNLVSQLIAEFGIQTQDSVIAYRGHHRWVQNFEAVKFDGGLARPARLREEGVYLITGGLGGVGLTLAKYLAQSVRARLVLVGRSAFPAKDEWESRLASHGEDSASRKIQTLQSLEEMGAEILVFNADVADQDQMRKVIDQVYEQFGQIHGVIHAAGISQGGLIQLKKPAAVSEVFAPKIKGTLVLDNLFQNANLDFLLLCSSGSSIDGTIGQVDYSAANAFLDAFAHSKASTDGTFTLSVNWDTWREVGMAARLAVPEALRHIKEGSLNEGMSPAEGIEVFSRVLSASTPQVVISTRDLQARLEETVASRLAASSQEPEKFQPVEQAHGRPELTNDYVAATNEVEQTISEIWQELLGIDRIGIHDNFLELGGHSLLATQVISRLREIFQARVPLNTLFENLTVAELAAAVEDILIEQIDELSEDEAEDLLKSE